MLKPEKIILPVSRQFPLPKSSYPEVAGRDIARTLLCLLRRCTSLNQFREIQAQMLLNYVQKPNFLIPKAVDLGDYSYAFRLFSAMEEPNEYSFNIMIRGLTTTWEDHGAAISLYRRMKFSGLKPDNFTYPFVFIACGNLSELDMGKSVHSSVFKVGLERDYHVNHSLITMYAKCGELSYARKMFDEITEKDLVSWNSMISGYSQRGYANDAVSLFRKMKAEGFQPDEKTLVSVLGACGDLGDLRMGKLVEEIAVQKKMEISMFLGSALISMYGKCGELESARRVFDKKRRKDRVTWNAMITVYAQNGMSEEAIRLFHQMKEAGIYPDAITLAMILSACASIGALELGKWVETCALERGFELNIYVATALVDMYAKCGSLDNALRVFEAMPIKNEVSWNVMICALAFHGRAQEALSLFNRMKIPPNDVTFVGVLSACVHAGLVDQGRRFFHQMRHSFGLVPKIEHFTCMVDLLSRAGLLNEAWEFIEKMPERPDEIMLGALLGACQKRKNVEIGERAMKMLLELEPSNSGNYVISSKVYADLRMWEECAKMRVLMRKRGVVKTPGCSWIEIDGELREFHAGDALGCDRECIRWLFSLLIDEIKREGHIDEEDFGETDSFREGNP